VVVEEVLAVKKKSADKPSRHLSTVFYQIQFQMKTPGICSHLRNQPARWIARQANFFKIMGPPEKIGD
jgi:hypothetical protein